jgi:SAM-dependent methyltransferase
MTSEPNPRTVLHVGCGVADPRKLPADFFPPDAWHEARLDIDPAVAPDILASITDMAIVADESADAVYSAHNLEHLFAHEVPLALGEFHRVLRPGGFVLITVPDLQRAAALIAEDLLEEPAYHSPAGPISPLDMVYGFRAAIAAGNGFMAHRTGFTARTLEAALRQAGFPVVRVIRDEHFALWATAWRAPAAVALAA